MADAQQLDVSDAVDNSGGAPPQWTRRATRADLPPDTATLKMPLKDRKVPNVGQLSDGSLAGEWAREPRRASQAARACAP